MPSEVWGLGFIALASVVLGCPWLTKQRTWSRLLRSQTAWRGRHRFPLPELDSARLLIGARLPFGRLVGQMPDTSGRGGWYGRMDGWGRVHVDRWLDPPTN